MVTAAVARMLVTMKCGRMCLQMYYPTDSHHKQACEGRSKAGQRTRGFDDPVIARPAACHEDVRDSIGVRHPIELFERSTEPARDTAGVTVLVELLSALLGTGVSAAHPASLQVLDLFDNDRQSTSSDDDDRRGIIERDSESAAAAALVSATVAARSLSNLVPTTGDHGTLDASSLKCSCSKLA
jgi:hypothetical protein